MRAGEPIEINNWNFGGLSDSKWSGTKYSLYRMVGLDIHSEPGVVKAEQKLTKNSGTTITEFCKWQVVSSNGRIYSFSADSGKVWETQSDGTVTLVFTTTAAAGEVKCLGAIEYRGYIIWCTQSRIHRILASSALGSAQWTANASLNWQTFGVTNLYWHPMVEQNTELYIGDGNYLALWDGSTFTADALDIKSPLVIKSLGKIDTDVLIGTYVDDNVNKTEVYRWNTWSVSWISSDTIDEVGINAFIPADNAVYVSAGVYGNIYQYDGQNLQLFKRIPGSYSPSAKATIHPDAVTNLCGQILFGVSNVTGNPCLEGVYRLGRNCMNYPLVMDMPYPISERSGDDFVMSGIEIGSIVTYGQKILVSWKNGTSYGVDILDSSNKLSGAYYETRVMRYDRFSQNTCSKILLSYNSLPESTSVAMSYDKNYAGSYTTPTSSQIIDTDRKIISLEEGIEHTALQLKTVLTCSSNSTPSLEGMNVYIS